METLRYLFGGLLLVFGAIIVLTNYLRQISNFRNRKKDGHWSSPAPFIGPLFIVLGYSVLPIEFSKWVFLAVILDPDTAIVVIGLPSLLKALKEEE